jgi:hypothetical protein
MAGRMRDASVTDEDNEAFIATSHSRMRTIRDLAHPQAE